MSVRQYLLVRRLIGRAEVLIATGRDREARRAMGKALRLLKGRSV
ncbi:hypothetical protein [Psychromicrobium lacuslunae]|nr:hypothetical protein [Psychromicrobium lacuslunae]